jgi:hypothetical protein
MAEKTALLTKKLQQGIFAEENNQTGDSIKLYEEIIREHLVAPDEVTDDAVKAKETATYRLANIFKDKGLVDELIQLQKDILPLYVDIPKSKQAKIVRTLFDLTTKVEGRNI